VESRRAARAAETFLFVDILVSETEGLLPSEVMQSMMAAMHRPSEQGRSHPWERAIRYLLAYL
jgi:hypothetical protein